MAQLPRRSSTLCFEVTMLAQPTLYGPLRRARARLPAALEPVVHRAKGLVREARGIAGLSDWVYAVHRGPLPFGGPSVEVSYVGRATHEENAVAVFRPHALAAGWRREVVERGGLATFLAARRDPTPRRGASAPVLLVDPLFDWIGELEGAYRLPLFLRAVLPVAGTLEAQLEQVRSKPYRRFLKRAHKRGVTWRISREISDVRVFHQAMYEPLARHRFGPAAQVCARDVVERAVRGGGELLLVEERGLLVAGALLYRSPRAAGTLFNWKYGIREPDRLEPAALRERTAAVEVALFEHALSCGDRWLDFGLTAAVANDGVYVHKRRLGCDFAAHPDSARLWLRLRNDVQPIVFERVPLFVAGGDGLRCLTGYTGARGRDNEPFTKGVLRECTFVGCERVSLFANAPAEDVMDDFSFTLEVTEMPGSRGV